MTTAPPAVPYLAPPPPPLPTRTTSSRSTAGTPVATAGASYQARPLRFEYVLTEKGLDLYYVVVALMKWGDRWATRRSPPVELYFRDTGDVIEPVLVDAK